jgi:hypothetical protein
MIIIEITLGLLLAVAAVATTVTGTFRWNDRIVQFVVLSGGRLAP